MRAQAIVGSLIVVLSLSACVATTPIAENTPAASPSADTTPAPASTPAPAAAVIPTDCATLVDTATYTATFGDTPLNDPIIAEDYPLGVLTPTAPEAGASPAEVISAAAQLRCLWRYPEADITNLQVEVGTVDATMVSAYLATLPASGYTCEQALGGTRCQLISIEPQYQVEEGDTVFLRDNVAIQVHQDNVATNNLLGAIVTRIWPA
jgi:hypothetical protein